MDIKQLAMFCGEERAIVDLTRPWALGNHTYASDGHILVRCQAIDGVLENENAPDVRLEGVSKPFSTEPKEWVAIPDFQVEKKVCGSCLGNGVVNTCPECDGEGLVCLSTAYNEYEHTCDSCGGDGFIKEKNLKHFKKIEPQTCERCEGKGFVTDHKGIRISGVLFSQTVLDKLRHLPGVEIGALDSMGPSRFRFSGGDGIVMPMHDIEAL